MTDEARALAIVDETVARQRAVVADRSFRFRATHRADAEAYLASLTTFRGCSLEEIAAREVRLGGRFPLVYRSYLRRCGHDPAGLFVGSDVGFARHDDLRAGAEWLLDRGGLTGALPDNADVFVMHQGYSFLYVLADGGFDGPVFGYVEGEEAIEEMFASFEALLDAEVSLIEDNNRASADNGGTWLTVRPDGSKTEMFYPSLLSGERPIEFDDDYLD